MADTEPKKVGIFVEAELHREAKTKAAQEGTSFQQVLLPMLESWVKGTASNDPRPAAPSSRHARWHAILDQLLDSGDRDQIQIIQQQLLLFERIHNQSVAHPAAKTKKVG